MISYESCYCEKMLGLVMITLSTILMLHTTLLSALDVSKVEYELNNNLTNNAHAVLLIIGVISIGIL